MVHVIVVCKGEILAAIFDDFSPTFIVNIGGVFDGGASLEVLCETSIVALAVQEVANVECGEG